MIMDGRLDLKVGMDFLLTEIGTGMTFSKLARDANPNDADKRKRNRHNARIAYDTVLKFRGRVRLDERANEILDDQLEELRSCLRELGEVV
jgi:hypothetical protein